jgi:hypothetical protein
MLFTDWMRPTTPVLARLHDTRAAQFWDAGHALARRLSDDARAPQPEPVCCRSNGVLWDLAAVYPPGAHWEGRMPPAVFFNGPVVRVKEKLEPALADAAVLR